MVSPQRVRPKPPSLTHRILNTLPSLPAFVITFAHVLLSPYTKVEESFALHAAHDVLTYRLSPSYFHLWDHITFPGAVPRSFLPPVLLGLLTYPLSALSLSLGLLRSSIDVQILLRLVLASIHSICLNHLSCTIRTRYSSEVRAWFLLLYLSSFHIPYYAGRTLPNFLALPFVLMGVSLVLSRSNLPSISKRRIQVAIVLMTATATVVRLELALFILPTVLSLILRRRLTLRQAVAYGAIGGFGSLSISAPLDYILWRPTLSHPSFPFTNPLQLLWPELSALQYNLVQGKAEQWGVSPWYYYLTNALPKTCLASLPLAISGVVRAVFGRYRMRSKEREILGLFGLGVITLIGGMSCVGHKEWRFVVYAVPVINLLAAITASALLQIPNKRLRPLIRLGLVGMVAANLAVTGASTFLSIHNYPGGEVWRVLEDLRKGSLDNVTIHFTNYPLQTGASLFTFLHLSPPPSTSCPAIPPPVEPLWEYSKSEASSLGTPAGAWEAGADYLVTDDWEAYERYEGEIREGWEVVGSVNALGGVGRGGRRGRWGVEIRWARKIAILGRVGLS